MAQNSFGSNPAVCEFADEKDLVPAQVIAVVVCSQADAFGKENRRASVCKKRKANLGTGETHLIRTRTAKSATTRMYCAQVPKMRWKKMCSRTRTRLSKTDCVRENSTGQSPG